MGAFFYGAAALAAYGHLRDYDRLGLHKETMASHAVEPSKPASCEQSSPLLPRHQRAQLALTLGVTREEPPPIRQAERRLNGATRLQGFVYEEDGAPTKEPIAVPQSVANKRGGVKDVRSNGKIIRMRGEAL
mmetsp:Transcript_7935/g.23799  ORF Transcript_7935/g.23799 Transcript_7935/m.23799 type:complete len:132 (+) Transcript_7935:2758-3153(+)